MTIDTADDGSATAPTAFDGGCACRTLRYRLTRTPLVIHCCHCRWCQRETGSAFALNAMIEADAVVMLSGEPEMVLTPSLSGKGTQAARCPSCRLSIWSHYSGAGDAISFVRVGTLDEPDLFSPDIHIFTMSKQPWVQLPAGMLAFDGYYERDLHWPAAGLERWRIALERYEQRSGKTA